MKKTTVATAMRNWAVLAPVMGQWSEEKLLEGIEHEMSRRHPRIMIINRLHSRLTTLRRRRERARLLSIASGKKGSIHEALGYHT